jgi:hypothetical protein
MGGVDPVPYSSVEDELILVPINEECAYYRGA